MVYKYSNSLFWFDGKYIISSYRSSSELEYYSLLNFSKVNNDYLFIEENNLNKDYSNFYNVNSEEEFNKIVLQKRREYKLNLIIDSI